MQERGIGGGSDLDVGCAAYFSQMSAYEGNSIVRVRLGFVGSVSDVYVFVSKSLDGEPLYTERAYGMAEGWNEITLAEPVELDGDPLYVGYTCTVPGGEYSIGYSTLPQTENAFFLDAGDGNGFQDVSDTYSPVSIEVVVSGSNFTVNGAAVTHVQHAFVAASSTDGIPQVVTIANEGAEPISSLQVAYRIGEDEGVAEFDGLNIARYGEGDITVNLPMQEGEGEYDVAYEVTAVNGEANEADGKYEAAKRVHVVSQSMPRMVVCEEFTGNLCGYCPQGIVAIEDLNERYPDKFVAVVVHYYNSNDPMYFPEYGSQLVGSLGNIKAPYFIFNRSSYTDSAYPEGGTASGHNLLEDVVTSELEELTCGSVDISTDREAVSGNSVDVTVETTFNVGMERS